MWKRFIYGGLFAVVCAALVTIILLQRFNKITPIEVLQAVPADAIVYMEDVDYEYLTESFIPGSRIWIDFVNTTGKTRLDSLINRLLGQLNTSETLNDLLMKEGFDLSLHLIGKDQLIPLFYIRYSELHSDNDFKQVMLDLLKEQAMLHERKYEAETVYDVSGKPGFVPGKFSYACVKGICLISPSSILVEESVRTIHSDTDFSADDALQLVRGTAGRYVHANIYINYSKLNLLFYPFISHSHWDRIASLSGIATWGELDLDIKEDAIVLNGMSHAAPDTQLFLGAFADQSPVKMEVHEVMPAGTSYFLHMGISDRAAFMDQLTTFYTGMGVWTEIETEIDRLEKLYGINPLEDLVQVMDDEMAWFAIEGETKSQEDEVLVLETRSKSETSEVVMRWIERYLQVHAFDMQSLRFVYRLDDQTSFNIYRLPDPFFSGMAPGRLFNRYFTVYENYLLFGPSVEVLSRVIYQNVLHKTFLSDPVFKEMSDYLSNRSNISLFFRPSAYLDYNPFETGDKHSGTF